MDPVELLERLRWPFAGSNGIRVTWFDSWDPLLDDALQLLPQSQTTSHELLRLLMQSPSRPKKRTALLTDEAGPLAVIGLRRRKQFWEPVWGGGINGRYSLPVREGSLLRCLQALNANVWVVTPDDPSAFRSIRSAVALPLYQIPCSWDFDRYWRNVGHITAIKAARNRTRSFHLEVDRTGDAEWVIRQWANKWQDRYSDSDMVLAAEHYLRAGRYHSFVLYDGSTPTAGLTLLVDDDVVLAHVTYRAPEYQHHGVGTRVYELAFQWAAESKYALIDLGYSYKSDSYKVRWAPQVGNVWLANFAPIQIHVARAGVRLARKMLSAPGSVRRSQRGPRGETQLESA